MLTRAQKNGTEPMIKTSKKVKKTKERLHLSEDEVTEPVIAQSEPLPVQSEPVPVQSEPLLVQSEPVIVQSEPLPVQSEPVIVQSEPVCEVASVQSPMFEPLSPCSQDEVVPFPSKAFADLTKMVIKGPTMPDWKLIKHVKNIKKLDNYMFMKDEIFKQNNKARCQLCVGSEHEMRAKYTAMCSCGYAFCLRRHRPYVCCDPLSKKPEVKLYVKGNCSHSHLMPERSKNTRLTKDKGINPAVKVLIRRMLTENVDITPKMCHLMLIKSQKVNLECMPLLHQVYIVFYYLSIFLIG